MTIHARILAAGVIAAIAGTAHAQVDVFWVNGDGLWSDMNNWSGGVVPNNDGKTLYNATLDANKSPYTVTADLDITLQNFSLLWSGATLDLADRLLTVNQDLTVTDGTILRSGNPQSLMTSVGGSFAVSGNTTFQNAGIIQSTGSLSLDASAVIDVCNTCIDNRGAAVLSGNGTVVLDQGGEINNAMGASFTVSNASNSTITGDNTGRFVNTGTFNSGVSGRGILGVTFFQDVVFENTGTVNVLGGGLVFQTTNDLAPQDTLSGGKWTVSNNAFLDFGRQTSIRTLDADLTISGAQSSVSNINLLDSITTSGRFAIDQGQGFFAASQFTNGGLIEVGENSTFDASKFGMGNFDGPGLFFGSFIVRGSFFTGQEAIDFLGGDLTLLGPDSVFTGIHTLNTVGSSGRFVLDEGRGFETIGNFNAQEGAQIVVGDASSLQISGLLINNDTSGRFDAGAFVVRGTLTADNLVIKRIANELTLDGLASQLLDNTGNDAIAGLEAIEADGILNLRNGRSLDNLSNLVVDGVLSIDGAPASGLATPGTVSVSGTVKFTEASTLEILISGAADSLHGMIIAGLAEIDPGATLALVLNDDALLNNGEVLTLLAAGSVDGAFTNFRGLDIGNGLSFEIVQDNTGVYARVVPAPAPGGVLLALGIASARRRRR